MVLAIAYSGNRASSLRKNLDNLRWIDRRGRSAINDLQLPASRLVRDLRYLGLDNLSVVQADPDAGAYAVSCLYIDYCIVSIEAGTMLPD